MCIFNLLEWLVRKIAGVDRIEDYPCSLLLSSVAYNSEFDGQIVDMSLYDKLKIAKITLTNTAPPSIEELEVLMEHDADCDDFDEEEYCDLRTIKDKKDLELRLIVPHGILRKIIYKNGSYVWDIEFPKNMIKGIKNDE